MKQTNPIYYVNETNENINKDIIARKEFFMFKKSVNASKFATDFEEENEKLNIIPKFLISEKLSIISKKLH
jgi:hypothetical protein